MHDKPSNLVVVGAIIAEDRSDCSTTTGADRVTPTSRAGVARDRGGRRGGEVRPSLLVTESCARRHLVFSVSFSVYLGSADIFLALNTLKRAVLRMATPASRYHCFKVLDPHLFHIRIRRFIPIFR